MSRRSLQATRPPATPAPPPAETRLRLALDAFPDAFWVLDAERDPSGRIVDFVVVELNLSAARAAGVDADKARGRRLGDLASVVGPLGYIERYARIVTTGNSDVHEYLDEGVGPAPVRRRVHAVRSVDGVVVTVADIVDPVDHRRGSAGRNGVHPSVESASDMVVRVVPTGLLTYVSPASRALVGFAPQEMVGRFDRDFIHPDDLPALTADRRFLQTGADGGTLTYRARRKRGGWVWLEATSRGICDSEGVLREIEVAARDVTERTLAQFEHAALHRVSEAVAEGLDQADLYRLVAAEMANLLDADGGRVVRYVDATTAELLGVWRRSTLPQMARGEKIVLSPTWAIAKVMATGATATSQLTPGDAAMAGADLRMGIAAPVRFEGRVWGAVAAAFSDPGDAPVGAPMRVERFAKLVGLAVANAEARARLTLQATTDGLTGLANHGTFHAALAEEFARTARYGRPLSLAVIDLDRFKVLNDCFGHRAGDAALATVGALLRAHARQADIVGRIGGEELAWLMPETDRAGALEAAERLRHAIAAAPIGGPLGLTASIGVARRTQMEQDPENFFRRADAALYQAKQNGRDRVFATPG